MKGRDGVDEWVEKTDLIMADTLKHHFLIMLILMTNKAGIEVKSTFFSFILRRMSSPHKKHTQIVVFSHSCMFEKSLNPLS